MPLYLVRWPNILSVSVVKARNKVDLMDILDEVGDPMGCKIKEYRGPVFLSFDLNVKCNPTDGFPKSVEDVTEVEDGPEFVDSGDTGDSIIDMHLEMTKFAFPAYHAYLEDHWNRDYDDNDGETSTPQTNDKELCKNALQKDLEEQFDTIENVGPLVSWADSLGILDAQPKTKEE